jgi:hypothetical protein
MKTLPRAAVVVVALACFEWAACKKNDKQVDTKPLATAPASGARPAAAKYTPRELNALALRQNIPLFWKGDSNQNGVPDPSEVTCLLFYPTREVWVAGGQFTAQFHAALESLAAAKAPLQGTPAEVERRTLVRQDLDYGRTTLVYSDLRGLTPAEKTFVARMLEVSHLIDELYSKMNGSAFLRASVPADDPASQALLRRNQTSRCLAPKTEKNPKCSAIPGSPSPISDLYPAPMQKDDSFCKALEKHADAKKLLSPFVVVREQKGRLVAVPYSEVYQAEMGAISAKLREAHAALGPDEAALRDYLVAAAQAFLDNGWVAADEKWAAMNAHNSKWYVRVAPDETYWEPCRQKAGFHVTFARINRDSLVWQEKLKPVQQEMEDTLAALIGPAYKKHIASFKLPDFIDIVWNAGDDRKAFGGTAGQSLPNWGKVADENRGRTVVMSNLYQDPESLVQRRTIAESLLTRESLAHMSPGVDAGLFSTILHEATHNLGPAHDYAYQGRNARTAFGGRLAQMLEELKAQSGSLWYVDFLKRKGIVPEAKALSTYTHQVYWVLSQISRGMYDSERRPRPYSQLAAIQLGILSELGALAWDANAAAANGTDKGAFVIHFSKLPAASDALMKKVSTIKALNDKAGLEDLMKRFVDAPAASHAMIAERFQRHPIASLVYALDL